MITQLVTSFTGALGFCLVFRLRGRYLFAAAVYAEFLAWLMGAPTTLFLTPALLIPLIPGRPLYYAMYYVVRQESELAQDFARQTAEYALGIALGASLVWAFANMRRSWKHHG